MGLREAFGELWHSADDTMFGRKRLHQTSLYYCVDGHELRSADVVVPTNRLECDLVKFAISAELDRVFSRLPPVDDEDLQWKAPYHGECTWTSQWFVDAGWCSRHAIRYAMHPSVDGAWCGPHWKSYFTAAGDHPFCFFFAFVMPVDLDDSDEQEGTLGLAVALDAPQSGGQPRVVWLAHPDFVLGSYGLVLRTPAAPPDGGGKMLGGVMSYYDEDAFAHWPHRVLVEPPGGDGPREE